MTYTLIMQAGGLEAADIHSWLQSLSLPLESGRCNGHHHDQTCDNERSGNERDDNDAASRRRKLAADNVVLRLEVAMEAE